MIKTITLLSAALLLTGILTACQEQHKPEQIETTVGVVKVTQQVLPLTIMLQGRTVASMSAEVRPQVNGIIQQRLFSEGAKVKAGDVLYQIDAASYEATYAKADADLRTAQATLEAARLKDQRYQALLQDKSISHQDAEDAHAAFVEADARVAGYQAALKSARIDLQRTQITAPISGYVGISNVTPGALVSAAQSSALTTINTLDPMNVDLNESSKDLLELRKMLSRAGVVKGSADVSLILEDGSTYPHKGQLKVREVSVDRSTGSVVLRAQFANPDDVLLPGMFVRAKLEVAIDQHGIKVPQQGISRDNQGHAYALVVAKDGKIAKKMVTTEQAIGDQWVISSGLAAGDMLVVEGANKVRIGQTVKSEVVALAQTSKEGR
ncbi:efflux RND transporter periplasmic adaptor subunit [Shewanella fodinae]|uniref:efflux RND transporter periplasmic adaptor subunit n=1 Tax=Shewanella fodinae TaxID=552357 RepID=UPI0019B992BD|nr:efflux RND transporter periplasmic adaptor subunit [Shewanella fodinae]MCL2907599.1 efflux RND transporter periplasmic adaptor subunit [Shewanella fodinae]GGZ09508.1 acriflavine resistance protein E [Shewanella fodinae]